GMSGRASPKDLETMFQLIYLNFTAPRLDLPVWEAMKNQFGPYLANRGVDPDEVFNDTVQVTMAQHNRRARPLTPAVFAEVDPQKALTFYKDRFADASDFTFLFVGNVDTVSLKPLVEKYIASLPSTGRKETFRDNGGSPPKGIVEKIVRKGVEPKANTLILFTGQCTYEPQTRFALRALSELVQIKLNESLRAARRRVQPERRRRLQPPSASGVFVPVPVQLVARERGEADEERVLAHRYAEDAGPERGRRREGEGRADACARGGAQAEQLLACKHHGARTGRRRRQGLTRRVRRDAPRADAAAHSGCGEEVLRHE